MARMEMRHLRYFVAVAECGSFRRAAERLHIAQPALSRQIRALEAEAAVMLFEAGSRRRVLSAAGQEFLVDARAILASVDRAVARAQRTSRGEHAKLRIAFSEIASNIEVMSVSVAGLRATMPEVEIVMLPMTSWHQLDALLRDRIDAGFLFRLPEMDSRIGFHDLADDPVHAVLQRDHPLARRGKLLRRDLEGRKLLLTGRNIRTDFHRAVTEAFGDAAVPPVIEEVASAATVASLVSVGMGIGLLTASMRTRLPDGLVMRPIADLGVHFRFGLAWCPGQGGPLILRAVEAVREAVARMTIDARSPQTELRGGRPTKARLASDRLTSTQ